MMRVLMVSSDRQIFIPTSGVRCRMKKYAATMVELLILVCGASGPSVSDGNLKIIPISRWAAFSWQSEKKIDLVTSQDPFEHGLIGWFLARRLGAKLELQIHTDLGSPYFRRHSFLNRVRFWLARFLLPRADQIRVVSSRIKDFLVKSWQLPAEKIEIRPIVVDLERFKKTSFPDKKPKNNKNILMVCRLEREKNVALALRAFALASQRRPDLNLVIVGTGREEKKLRKMVKKLELDNKVTFAGWVDFPLAYYHLADLFLQTSNYEGYGLSLIEALAAGCPAVSTDVGVAREKGARIVEHQATSIAQGILNSLA